MQLEKSNDSRGKECEKKDSEKLMRCHINIYNRDWKMSSDDDQLTQGEISSR
jgi:hypothetical protein